MRMSPNEQDGQASAYVRVLAKAWSDAAFKQRLLADPAATLRAEGMDVLPGVELRVVENTEELVYLPLPARPLAELSDAELETLARGMFAEPVFDPGLRFPNSSLG